MTTPLLLLLLVMAKLYDCHVIYTKEPSRIRVAYEDWKPVRDSPLRHIRHPVYHKSNGYSYIPGKKGMHQTAEQSEKIEVFSPAPPTILGSFSVFGHATVNAREHASQINKKLTRPHLGEMAGVETRPKVTSYQFRHQYPHVYTNYHHSDLKRPQYAANEQTYFYEGSLRPPPQEQSKAYTHSSLSPASYYGYEQGHVPGQVFHDEKYYRPQKVYNTFQQPAPTYSTQHNAYKTTLSPSNYDSTYSYYSSPSSQIDADYYNQNPVGGIPFNTRTDTKVKPVTENSVHEHIPHFGRPFQNTQSFTTADKLNDNMDTFVTTFPAPSTVETKLRFSDVAQPFKVSSYENVAVTSSKPDNNQPVYTEDVYPISVTTIDVPTVADSQNIKNDYDQYDTKYNKPFKPSPYDHSNHKLTTNSYKNYNENNPPPFLPTPSTDVSPYLTEPKSEITTISPVLNYYQESNSLSSVDSKAEEPSESYTEIYSTVPIETTTKSVTIKPRRTRPPFSSTSTTNYNNQYWDSYYKHQRRRKPTNKVRSRDSLEKNNHSKQRSTTTTTTTPAPENEEPDVFDYTTTLPESIAPVSREQYEYTGDKLEPTVAIETVNEKHNIQNFESDERKTKFDEVTSTTSSTTTTTTAPTTQVTTTVPPVSVEPGNRLKNKYGNRPRFSIKDYREKLNRASTTASPHENEKSKPTRNETEFKFRRTKSPTVARTTTEPSESIQASFEHKFQKYKPRGTSLYKTTSTTTSRDVDVTTTERSNAFKPSTNRYKPGTGKYYSRYRTSTVPPKEVDDSPSTTTKVTIRPKGVFSAKRQPFPLKSKPTTPKSEDEEEDEMPVFSDSLKTNENEVYSSVITKKMDDSTTTTISSGDEKETYDKEEGEPTGLESSRVADLTSSSSNDFHQSSHYKSDKAASKRPLPKITLPTDNPILPLEAFFQIQQ
ncbi:mucin-2 [Halyomorpha halys]|uniref:mucin-2 n=1 Tax=Halyomorpha halys TaxID=286706 RepID=UPI0006D4FA87|nr:mucin-5AC [Halyomorpha halys]XP_014280448.1 mucin-5AC [Halyomorpha halys]XP_014280449.1 mucin-5AC [Halyomorpha halys]XP_014280451.1 mucin-5AC [Halyomorpha halys]